MAMPVGAAAHPLGNFTINRYSRIDVAADALNLRYVLDMAEIPAFQELSAMGAGGNAEPGSATADHYRQRKVAELARGLSLRIDGATQPLHMVRSELTFPPGQGDLRTLRLQADFRAALPTGDGAFATDYRDSNYPGRLGWKEIVVRAGAGASLQQSSAPPTDQSDELRAYPQDALATPLDRSTARFTFRPVAAGAAPLSATPAVIRAGARPPDRLAALIAGSRPGLAFFAFALAAAVLLGALHAVSPGHGKTVMAAYLVGTRARPRYAVLLGLSITATHTAGVLLLGVVTLFASRYVLPERLYPWLTLVSGLTVLLVGGSLILTRFGGWRRARQSHHGHHHHSSNLGWRKVMALGISGGLLPCPSALVVLLSAIALNRLALGLAIVVAFSAGVGVVLVAIGLVLAHGGALVGRLFRPGRLTAVMPVASAVVVSALGAVLSAQALGQVLR